MPPRAGMDWSGILVLAAALLTIGATQEVKFSGFLGCRFSDAVCQRNEECIDDNLFGSCQDVGSKQDGYRYALDRETLHLLESEITRLVEIGYTWSSLYTQCTVGNILLAFRLGVQPDRVWCDQGGAPPARYQEALTDDSKTILADYINDYYSDQPLDESDAIDDDVIDVDPYITPKKKDEYVTIHKYFKDKREDLKNEDDPVYEEPVYDSLPSMDYETNGPAMSYKTKARPMEYETNVQEVDYEPIGMDSEEELEEQEERLSDNLDSLLNDLRPSDLVLLKSYLKGMDQSESMQDMAAEDPAEMRDVIMHTEPSLPLEAEASRGYIWGGEDMLDNRMPEPIGDQQEAEMAEPTERDFMPEADEQGPLGEEIPSLSPPDAKLLGDLLQDKVDMDALSDGQIQRLLNHVDSMLYNLEDIKAQGPDEQAINQENNLPDEPVLEGAEKRVEAPIIVETVEPTQALPDPHDHAFDEPMVNPHTEEPKLTVLNTLQGYMHMDPAISSTLEGQQFLEEVEKVINLPPGSLAAVNTVKDGDLIFEVNKDVGMDAEMVAKQAMGEVKQIQNRTHFTLEDAGVGDDRDKLSVTSQSTSGRNGPKYFLLTFVLCGSMAGIVLAVIALYVVKRHSRSKERLKVLAATGDGCEASKDYQDLCRQRMQSKSSVKSEVTHQGGGTRVGGVASESAVGSPSSRSSTSSWSEEPVASNMDISTGHIVLSYMEDHLKNKDRLSEEWEALCAYEAEPSTTTVGAESGNMRKNRYSDVLPYDHSRVILSNTPNVSGSDYVNANTITDHDPRNPAYIATQGPLPHTVADFWQLVWEQGSIVIVCLSKLTENGLAMCHRYWPEEGSDLYHIYEVHLVSEHIWCDDYLVRSFYLKNLQTNETRTVTQFHFLTWPDLGIPTSAKALLDFRRKVNKSYRGRSCPIVVHCSDGVGRTGTYCLLDMVLNRMSKGAKEIDIAATLEHIRDQRANMVKTKEQFEFALAAVADEVHAILKALPQ